MSGNLKTVFHTYLYDIRVPEEKAVWQALKAKLRAEGYRIMGPVIPTGDPWKTYKALNGQTIELETKYLFDNQWNTAPIPDISDKGLRVFDWLLHSVPNENIRAGHWLEMTAEMREIRRNTNKCGFCDNQEPAANGAVFCLKCLKSPYLKESDLHLLRMRAIDDTSDLAPLTEAERAYLLPLYNEAQFTLKGERGAKLRADVINKADKAIRNAETERDGMLWLLDHNIQIDNVIYYSHTGRFGFGWRDGVSEDFRDRLEESGFPFPYDVTVK